MDREASETDLSARIYRLESVATRRQQGVFVAMQVASTAVLLWLSCTILSTFLGKFFAPATVDVMLSVCCVTLVVWQLVYVFRILAMRRAVLTAPSMPTGRRIAMATTIVPSREFELLLHKLEGMVQVDAGDNQLDLWVLDEEDDPRVQAMVRGFERRPMPPGMRIRYFTRKNTPLYNEKARGRRFQRFQERQKGGNINAWLDATRGESYDLITFVDLDHVPKPTFYRSVLPFFADRDVAFVQGPESFRNRDQNFVTRAACFERDTFFGLIHRSYFGLGLPVIVGSHTTFRAEVFQDLGGAYPVHLTEDYLIMLKLRALGKRGIFVDEVLAVGELPSTWAAYLGQQLRWASGGLDLLVRYFPQVWSHYSGKEKFFTFLLLNYYAWGTFFMLAKAAILGLLLCGVSLQLDSTLIAGTLGFIVVSMVTSYLWERQFFIEPQRRSFLLENAVMNNFLGALYSVSLLKALVAPNRPFHVTAKSTAQKRARTDSFSYPKVSALLLAVEVACLLGVWLGFDRSAAPLFSGHFNALTLPLLMSAAANLVILLAYPSHEQSPRLPSPPA